MRKRLYQIIPLALVGLCLLWGSTSHVNAQAKGGGGGGGSTGGGSGVGSGGTGLGSSGGGGSGGGGGGSTGKSGGGSVGSTSTTYGGTNFLGNYYAIPQAYGMSGANGTSPTNGTSSTTNSSSGSGSSGGISTGFATGSGGGSSGSSSSSSSSNGFSGVNASPTAKFGQALYTVQPSSTFNSGFTASASVKSAAPTLAASTTKPVYTAYVGFKSESAPVGLVTGDFQRAVSESTDLSKPGNKLQLVLVGDVVVLRGEVQNEHDRILAETLAGTTPGVRGVRSELTVRDATPLGMTSPR